MSNTRTENMRSDTFRKSNQQIWAIMSKDTETHILQMLTEGKPLVDIYDYAIQVRRKLAFILSHGHGFGKIRNNKVYEGGDLLDKHYEGPYATSFNKMVDLLLEQPNVPRTNMTPARERGKRGVIDTTLLVHLISTSDDFTDKDNLMIHLSYGEMNKRVYTKSLNKLNSLVEEIKSDTCQGDEMIQKLGLLAYDLSRLWPLERGSAGVNHWILRSIAAYKGVNLGVLQVRDLPFDICAMVVIDREQYANYFLAHVNKQLESQEAPSGKLENLVDLYFQQNKQPAKEVEMSQLINLTHNINDLFVASRLLSIKQWDVYLGELQKNNFLHQNIKSTSDISTLVRSLPDEYQTHLITALVADEHFMKLIKSPEKMMGLMNKLNEESCQIFWNATKNLLSKFIAKKKVVLFDLLEISKVLPSTESKQDFLLLLKKMDVLSLVDRSYQLESMAKLFKKLDADLFNILDKPASLMPFAKTTYDLACLFKVIPEKYMGDFLKLLNKDQITELVSNKENFNLIYNELKSDNGKINVFLNFVLETNELKDLHKPCNKLLTKTNKSEKSRRTLVFFQENINNQTIKKDIREKLSPEEQESIGNAPSSKGPGG